MPDVDKTATSDTMSLGMGLIPMSGRREGGGENALMTRQVEAQRASRLVSKGSA